MNLHYLRVFLTVAEHEHITRAAEELIISQAAVTKTIQHLEQEVGLELIERHGRRIVLTHAGRVLQGYARRLFAFEREMRMPWVLCEMWTRVKSHLLPVLQPVSICCRRL